MHELHDLLVDGTRFSPTYKPSMNSDHLPMALCAIEGLGGDFDALSAYRDGYKERLHELPHESAITHWRDGAGNPDSYAALFTWFRENIEHRGIESTVSACLPELIGSIAMGAFHPIIRLGYAIDFKSQAETAAALAYLVTSQRGVPIDTDKQIDLAGQMHAQASSGPRAFAAKGFSAGIAELLVSKTYPTGRGRDLDECASVALDIYRATRNFFALHMVTATQATRICASLIDDEIALAALTGGLLAAHLVVGSPEYDARKPAAAPAHLDTEHAFKYAWSCLSEYRHYGDVRYAEEVRLFRDAELIPQWCAATEL